MAGSKMSIHSLLTNEEMRLSGLGLSNKIENPLNLTDNDKETLNRILKGNKHMHTLYVSENGFISQVKFLYEGGFEELKEYDGKYFTKMGQKPKEVFNTQTKRVESKKVNVPLDPSFIVVYEHKNPEYVRKEVRCTLGDNQRIMNLLMDLYKPGYTPTTKYPGDVPSYQKPNQ